MFIATSRRPLDSLASLRRLNSALDEAFGSWPTEESGGTPSWLPACDVLEDKDAVKLLAELPGVRPEDVKLSVENNILTIRGEKRQQSGDPSGRVHERSYGRFERSFALPSTIDPEKISAKYEQKYEHGILTVTIPKSEKARPREIPVSSVSSNQPAQMSSGPSVQTQGSKNRQAGTEKDAKEEGSAARTGPR